MSRVVRWADEECERETEEIKVYFKREKLSFLARQLLTIASVLEIDSNERNIEMCDKYRKSLKTECDYLLSRKRVARG